MADDKCKSYKNNCLRPLILGVTLPFIRVSNVFKSSCSGAGRWGERSRRRVAVHSPAGVRPWSEQRLLILLGQAAVLSRVHLCAADENTKVHTEAWK